MRLFGYSDLLVSPNWSARLALTGCMRKTWAPKLQLEK